MKHDIFQISYQFLDFAVVSFPKQHIKSFGFFKKQNYIKEFMLLVREKPITNIQIIGKLRKKQFLLVHVQHCLHQYLSFYLYSVFDIQVFAFLLLIDVMFIDIIRRRSFLIQNVLFKTPGSIFAPTNTLKKHHIPNTIIYTMCQFVKENKDDNFLFS